MKFFSFFLMEIFFLVHIKNSLSSYKKFKLKIINFFFFIMLNDVEYEQESDIRKIGKNEQKNDSANPVYVIFITIALTILFAIWKNRPNSFLNHSFYKAFNTSERIFTKNFNITLKARKTKIVNFSTFSLKGQFTAVTFSKHGAPLIYSGYTHIFDSSNNLVKSIPIKETITNITFPDNSSISKSFDIISETNFSMSKIVCSLSLTSIYRFIDNFGINVSGKLQSEPPFLQFFRKILLFVLLFLMASSVVNKNRSNILLGCELLGFFCFFITKQEYSDSILSFIIINFAISLLYFFFLQNQFAHDSIKQDKESTIIHVIFSIVLFSFVSLNWSISQKNISTFTFIFLCVQFYFLFYKRQATSGSLVAFVFSFYVVQPELQLKFGYFVIGLAIFFFMVSEDYWLTVLILFCIPIPFMFSPFDVIKARISNTAGEKYMASINYTSDWVDYKTPHFLLDFPKVRCPRCKQNSDLFSSSIESPDIKNLPSGKSTERDVILIYEKHNMSRALSLIQALNELNISAKIVVFGNVKIISYSHRPDLVNIKRCGGLIMNIGYTNSSTMKLNTNSTFYQENIDNINEIMEKRRAIDDEKLFLFHVIYDFAMQNKIFFNRIMYINPAKVSLIGDPFLDEITDNYIYTMNKKTENDIFVAQTDTMMKYAKDIISGEDPSQELYYLPEMNSSVSVDPKLIDKQHESCYVNFI